jgi:hypothetical protein
MPRHRQLTKRIPGLRKARIGLAIEVPRRTNAGLLESFHTDDLRRELERADSRVRREAGIPAFCNGEAASARLPHRYLADQTVIRKFKRIPPRFPAHDMLQAHDMRLPSYWRISGLQPT